MAKDDDEVRAALRAGVMRFAVGATEKNADEVLDVILKGWGFRDCAQLAQVVPLLVVPGLGPNGVLFFLDAFVKIGNQSRAGRKLILQAAKMLALIDNQEQAAPSN